MRREHRGKIRDWFLGDAKWSIVILDTFDELEGLIFFESSWTKAEGLVIPDGTANYRLLAKVATNAAASGYLRTQNASGHRKYRDDLQSGHLRLVGGSRIALCSAEDSERRSNPAGSFYLLDGVGRCLPLVMLVQAGQLPFHPVEAFLVEKGS